MAKVLEHMTRPQKKAVHRSAKALELQTAKEILQEVFCTTSAEVEEMIRLRLAERDSTI